MLRYKTDIMARLKANGYPSTRLRKEKIFGESMMQRFRTGAEFPHTALNTLCQLLNCQVGDIIEYVPDGVEQAPREE